MIRFLVILYHKISKIMVTCSNSNTEENNEYIDGDYLESQLDKPIDEKRWNNMVVVTRLPLFKQEAIEKQQRKELERARSFLPPSRRALKRRIKKTNYVTPLNDKWRHEIKKQVRALIPNKMPPLVHNILILRVYKLIELYQLDVNTRTKYKSTTNKPKFHISNVIACCIEAVEEVNRMSPHNKIKGVEGFAVTLARIILESVTREQSEPDLDRQLRRARYTRKKGIERLQKPIGLKRANKIISTYHT